jgi:hypothetical protein
MEELTKHLCVVTERMESCYQFEDMNMIEHGESVHNNYTQLLNQLEGGKEIINLPRSIYELYDKTKHLLVPNFTAYRYHLYHDCGKPLCLVETSDGKRQYPNHEIWSSRQFLEIWSTDYKTATLILMDMDFHKLRGDDLVELWKDPLAATLYWTAWAEVISNSKMFGGYESDSFKIKRKRLINAAKKYGNNHY